MEVNDWPKHKGLPCERKLLHERREVGLEKDEWVTVEGLKKQGLKIMIRMQADLIK